MYQLLCALKFKLKKCLVQKKNGFTIDLYVHGFFFQSFILKSLTDMMYEICPNLSQHFLFRISEMPLEFLYPLMYYFQNTCTCIVYDINGQVTFIGKLRKKQTTEVFEFLF